MSKTIKLLVIPSWYPPDGGYFFKEHSEALMGEGCEVDVLVNRLIGVRRLNRIGRGEWRRFVEGNENGLWVVRSVCWKIPGNEKFNIRRWVRSTEKLFDKYAIKYGMPDLILAHSATWAGCAAARICRRHSIPFVITEHRSFFTWRTEAARKMIKPYYIPFLKEAYEGCTRLVIVSEDMKRGLQELFPGIESKITVIPNMVNGDYFSFPLNERTLRPFVFFSAGRLSEVKGLDIMIEAFSRVMKRTETTVVLKIAGRGEMREQLEEQADKAGTPCQIIFLGRIAREKVREEMQEANCFLLASRYEAFGVVLIESMATGLPVIATRSGGPEQIVDDSCGYLVEPDDVEGLAAAMLRMIENYGTFDQREIRERTLKRYGSRNIAGEYVRIFEEILE